MNVGINGYKKELESIRVEVQKEWVEFYFRSLHPRYGPLLTDEEVNSLRRGDMEKQKVNKVMERISKAIEDRWKSKDK